MSSMHYNSGVVGDRLISIKSEQGVSTHFVQVPAAAELKRLEDQYGMLSTGSVHLHLLQEALVAWRRTLPEHVPVVAASWSRAADGLVVPIPVVAKVYRPNTEPIYFVLEGQESIASMLSLSMVREVAVLVVRKTVG